MNDMDNGGGTSGEEVFAVGGELDGLTVSHLENADVPPEKGDSSLKNNLHLLHPQDYAAILWNFDTHWLAPAGPPMQEAESRGFRV